MAAMHINGKSLKNVLLQNRMANTIETLITASGTRSTTKIAQMMTLG